MKTLVFEDHGQDFLEWDIDEKNIVIACRPFQEWLWKGYRVLNETIKPGSLLSIVSPQKKDVRTINYRIEKVIQQQ